MPPILNRRRLILCGLGVLLFLVVAIGTRWRMSAEPTWKGKPAFYWLGQLALPGVQGYNAPAMEFLYVAGPAVIPELVRGLGLRDSWLHDRWTEVYSKLGKWQRLFRTPTNRAMCRSGCARGLGLLGSAAGSAVPALLQALDDNDSGVRSVAAEALGRIGAEKARVVPELVAGLASTNSIFRCSCVVALGRFLPNPVAARALRKAMRDPDVAVRTCVPENLWRDESDPEATLAALVTALHDGDPLVREFAARSLGKLRHKQEASAQALLAGLEAEIPVRRIGRNELVVWRIVTALGELGEVARLAVPLLTQLAAETNRTGTLSIVALGRIDPQNAAWTDQLVKRLEGSETYLAAWELGKQGDRERGAVGRLRQIAQTAPEWKTRVMAATAAWRLDPSSPNPLKRIADELPQQERGYPEVIMLLGELGPAAKMAVPALRQLRYIHGAMAHEVANEALQNIAPEYVADPWRK